MLKDKIILVRGAEVYRVPVNSYGGMIDKDKCRDFNRVLRDMEDKHGAHVHTRCVSKQV